MYSTEIKAFEALDADVLTELCQLTEQITELDRPQTMADIEARVMDNPCLVLIAYVEGELAGFKIGYQKSPEQFYSWLGGVHPDFRQLGLAASMLEYQEKWAAKQGYQSIAVKTRNKFNAMLNMLVSRHYHIIGMAESSQNVAMHKLHLEKQL
ncbi:GNAT family N-acetyltransferase [Shewanella maritima]|uniref:GNAT family N-acetyltransferase n=1 Tax=Shewanella maritima TaxID=2520507 RepID=UPI00373710DC